MPVYRSGIVLGQPRALDVREIQEAEQPTWLGVLKTLEPMQDWSLSEVGEHDLKYTDHNE